MVLFILNKGDKIYIAVGQMGQTTLVTETQEVVVVLLFQSKTRVTASPLAIAGGGWSGTPSDANANPGSAMNSQPEDYRQQTDWDGGGDHKVLVSGGWLVMEPINGNMQSGGHGFRIPKYSINWGWMVIMEMVALEEVQGVWMNVDAGGGYTGGTGGGGTQAEQSSGNMLWWRSVVPTTQELNKSILPGQIMDMVR